MFMNIVYLPSTKDDLIWFHHYYTHVFPEGSVKALRKFDAMAEILSVNPFIGKKITGKVRKLTIPKTPFSYIYQITSTQIEILRIWDDRKTR